MWWGCPESLLSFRTMVARMVAMLSHDVSDVGIVCSSKVADECVGRQISGELY